jgi:cation transporter-like permease
MTEYGETLNGNFESGAMSDSTKQEGEARIRLQIEMAAAIDTKAGVLIGFVAVSIVQLLAYLLSAAAERSGSLPFFGYPILAAVLVGVVASFAAVVAGFLALSSQSWEVGLPLGARFDEKAWSQLEEHLDHNLSIMKKKRIRLKLCASLVLAAILSYSIAIILLLFTARPLLLPQDNV